MEWPFYRQSELRLRSWQYPSRVGWASHLAVQHFINQLIQSQGFISVQIKLGDGGMQMIYELEGHRESKKHENMLPFQQLGGVVGKLVALVPLTHPVPGSKLGQGASRSGFLRGSRNSLWYSI